MYTNRYSSRIHGSDDRRSENDTFSKFFLQSTENEQQFIRKDSSRSSLVCISDRSINLILIWFQSENYRWYSSKIFIDRWVSSTSSFSNSCWSCSINQSNGQSWREKSSFERRSFILCCQFWYNSKYQIASCHTDNIEENAQLITSWLVNFLEIVCIFFVSIKRTKIIVLSQWKEIIGVS